ncbi:polyprenyl synthetase family protein [Opitutus terrae]|uniref:Polyprenyl synthetase n=1 Tax=Opitutus terrae (strain DSM 11246 / JCM 15787 / PB90-1) TaxID=452637 RepID=B1ZZ25_OPITP|nr:polyprenyl synthetase family protein [Opitutus terrae]ACB77097.1 Polyprenyl synthetase [Opitutus terrae PB90-1]
MDFAAELRRLTSLVEEGIERHLPPAATRPGRLHEAMRYSLQAGGKRLRPVLLLASAELCGGSGHSPSLQQSATPEPPAGRRGDLVTALALPAAVAIECLHTYSLIHDDLPCMDDDDLRRGRPTAHKAFDEATALLAGDALLTHAFALLAENYASQPALAMALIRELADAAGSRRLIGGQMEDLLAEKKADATAEELEFIHLNKTAAMIEASLVMGGWIGLHAQTAAPGALPPEITALRAAGRHLGLAFQIIDDVLDATADRATLGKTPGKDARAGKTTFVSLHGLDRSRQFAREHTAAARQALASLEREHAFLDALIDSLVTRAK